MGKMGGYSLFLGIPINYDGLCVFKFNSNRKRGKNLKAKVSMHWLLVLVLVISAMLPGMTAAKESQKKISTISELAEASESSEQNVKQLMAEAMEQIENFPEMDPPKNNKRVEYALFELQAAVDGNFETNNAIKAATFFDHSKNALGILEANPHITSEEKTHVINTVISANRMVTKELLALLDKNIDLFSNKDKKLLDQAHKEYEKGLDFEHKNNREQSVHFYKKSWISAQELKVKAKQLLDSDSDGATNAIEEKIGTNKEKPDTDGDGLLDGFEILKLYTSPLKQDTNNNDTTDNQEDTDQDGLTNLQEQVAETDPVLKDSDSDGLEDRIELEEFGTSPLLKDTDHDGLNDFGEYQVGSDPHKKDSDRDRLYDGLESFTQTFTENQSGTILELQAQGDISPYVQLKNVSDYSIFQDVSGAVSDFVEITVEKEFEQALVKIPFDENDIPNGDIENIKMYRYDKENHSFTQLENQEVDRENGLILAETDQFSVFTLIYTPDSQNSKTLDLLNSLKSSDSYQIANEQDDADFDGDGLTYTEELEQGTYIYFPDTDSDGLNDGLEVDIGADPFTGNADGDSYNDLEEYNNGTDPDLYDKVWTDYVQEVLLGASVNEFGETLVDWGWMDEETFNSIPYLIGQLVSGYLVYGDIVDFVANLTQADIGDGLLAAAGVIPVVGDAGKTIAKLLEFVKRTKDNLPKAYRIILDEFGDNPAMLSRLLDEISEGAAATLRRMGASDRMIAQLGKHGNDLQKISRLSGIKLGDLTLDATQRNIINRQIRQRWGTYLNPKKRAEAFAMEAAIWYYEQQGYKLLYSQRDINPNILTSQGPDIVMKSPTGEPLIIEAKGSHSEKGKLNDGKEKRSRLASNVGGQLRYYLDREWMTVNSQNRYMDAFERAIANGTISPEEREAYNLLKNIIDNGAPYKSSVVYGGIRDARSVIEAGRKIDEYLENVIKDTQSLDFIIIRNL